jgi:hypothetical protein
MNDNLKYRLKTCDRFLKRIRNKPQYAQTYRMFRVIRMDLETQLKKKSV